MNPIPVNRRRWAMIASTAVMLMAVTVSGVAPAAEASPKLREHGTVTLYTGSPIDSIMRFGYHNCASASERPVHAAVVRFENRAVAGCHALLVDRTGGTYLLCGGTGTIPEAFQNAPRLRIGSGPTPPC